MKEQQATAMERFPVLDGIRGIAILSVLFNHLPSYGMYKLYTDSPLLGKLSLAGWIGVDIFFVLSGFLITGILINTNKTIFYYKRFYFRRILRIFPVYYSALLLIVNPSNAD